MFSEIGERAKSVNIICDAKTQNLEGFFVVL